MNFSELAKINVNEHTEKKGNLTYLSWAWAVAELLKLDPEANWTYAEPKQYGDTMMVFCSVTAFGRTRTSQLPVMDNRNKAIPSPDAMQVNTAMQRALAKAIALHGLGLYIYAGEDLPEDEATAPVVVKAVTADKKATVDVEVNTGDADANAQLFADGMITYTNHCEDAMSLNRYWKANQTQLDGLKVSHPALYEQVRNRFAELKKQFSEKQ